MVFALRYEPLGEEFSLVLLRLQYLRVERLNQKAKVLGFLVEVFNKLNLEGFIRLRGVGLEAEDLPNVFGE